MGSSSIRTSPIIVSTTLALSLVAIQAAAIRLSPAELPVRIILPLTIALAPLALWPHRRHLGTWVILVGLSANLAALLFNGGLMPIERSTVVQAIGPERAADYETGAWIAGSKDVLVADGEGRFVSLGDAIIVRAGSAGIAASPGDVVIVAGVVALIGEASLVALARRSRRGASIESIETPVPLAA